jgi:hypothetical protein
MAVSLLPPLVVHSSVHMMLLDATDETLVIFIDLPVLITLGNTVYRIQIALTRYPKDMILIAISILDDNNDKIFGNANKTRHHVETMPEK